MLALVDEATKGQQGKRTDLVDNIHEVQARPTGTSAQRAHRVLREKRPDLHAKVLAGELTAHANRQVSPTFRPNPELRLTFPAGTKWEPQVECRLNRSRFPSGSALHGHGPCKTVDLRIAPNFVEDTPHPA